MYFYLRLQLTRKYNKSIVQGTASKREKQETKINKTVATVSS